MGTNEIGYVGRVRYLPGHDLRGVGVGNADGSLNGSQEIVWSAQVGTDAAIVFNSWNGNDGGTADLRDTMWIPGVEILGVGVANVSPEEKIYDAGYSAGAGAGYADGYAAGYTNGLNITHGQLLNMLPPGIRKNVENLRGFAK